MSMHFDKPMRSLQAFTLGLGLGIAIAALPAEASGPGYAAPLGIGKVMTDAEAQQFIGLSSRADGHGLPPGHGDYAKGKEVYLGKCAACHGEKMEGIPTPGIGGDKLAGGRGTLASGKAVKTVESYWPYATTIFDYMYRAMPFNAPGSLTFNEVYSVIAYMLGEMNIISKDMTVNDKNLAKIKMPNRDGFIPYDPRPDVYVYR